MDFNKNNISNLIQSESRFFEEILSEYQFYLQVGNNPDGDWFNRLLARRQVHIKKLEFIFNNKNYLNIFENEIHTAPDDNGNHVTSTLHGFKLEILERLLPEA